MRILITGADGFIGSHLCDYYQRRGDFVSGVDNGLTGRTDNRISAGNSYPVDITDRDEFYRVANPTAPDLIFHCAASYHDPDAWHRDIDTNIAGMVNVVNAARFHNARLVYFQTALPPVSSYAISKTAALQYLELSGVDAMTFRLANVYGPRNLSGPVPTFYRKLTDGEPCTVVNARRDFVYVDDLIGHVTFAVSDDEWSPGIHDVRSGVTRPIWDVYQAVAATLHIDVRPNVIDAPADDVQAMVFHDPPIGGPVTPLLTGVSAACDWYAEHGVSQTYTHLKGLGHERPADSAAPRRS